MEKNWVELISDLAAMKNSTEQEIDDTELAPGYVFDVSTMDAQLNGWLQASGQLYTHFLISSEDIVVDLGCGDGGQLVFCGQQGAHIIAVDIDLQRLKQTVALFKEMQIEQYIALCCDGNPLCIADNTATKIICSEVLEHVDVPQDVLGELYRIGKPGAQYLIKVPDPQGEYLQKHSGAPDSYFQKPNHIHIIERDDFLGMVKESGLIIEHQSFCGFYMTMYLSLFWQCQSVGDSLLTRDPLALNWAKTWHMFLQQPNCRPIHNALNKVMPKSQIIIARKPN